MTARIRHARIEDAAACAEILNEWIDETVWMPRYHTATEVAQHYHDDVIRDRLVLLIEEEARIEGFLALSTSRMVTAFHIARRARRKGYGRMLLDQAKTLSPQGVTLWTFVANNGARRFYLREGFSELRRTEGDNEEGLPDILFGWGGDATRGGTT